MGLSKKSIVAQKAQQIEEANKVEDINKGKFWWRNKAGAVKVLIGELQGVLSKHGGFWKYRTPDKQTRIVRTLSAIVEISTTEEMKVYAIEYVRLNFTDDYDDVSEAILTGGERLFSKSALEFMPERSINFIRHTVTTAVYPFKNGVVEVTKDSTTITPYDKLNGFVWASQVIPIYYTQTIWAHCEFERFIHAISAENDERKVYGEQVVGYLCHTYKDPSRSYAIVLAEEVENEGAGGGTGKGIFFKAIKKIINVAIIGGKNFKHDKSFNFQRVDLDTQLIVIDDCRKNFDFEGLYDSITEGLTVEKKNKPEFRIDFETAPKFLLSTNYTISISGEHGRRRAKVLEFSDFFGPKRTPLDHFGHRMFDDWNADEWSRFYCYMMHCVAQYLKNGIQSIDSTTTIQRKDVRNRFSRDFMQFWDESINRTGQEMFLTDLYNSFLESSGNTVKDYSMKRFKAAIEFTAGLFGYTIDERKSSSNSGKRIVRFFKGEDTHTAFGTESITLEVPF